MTAMPALRRPAVLAGLLLLAAGCADLLEVQVDPVGDRRPSTMVRRLREQTAGLKDAYRQQRRGGYGPIDYFLDEIEKGGEALDEDVRRQGGQLGIHLARVRDAAVNLDPSMRDRGKVSPGVQHRWQVLRAHIADLVNEWVGLGVAGVYQQEAVPTRTVPLLPEGDGYDATFAAGNVQTGFAKAMKAWEAAPARRAGTAWARALDAELGAFSTGLGELARVKNGRKAEVQPVAARLAGRRDRIGELVDDHKTELPREFVEAWTTAGFWLGTLTE